MGSKMKSPVILSDKNLSKSEVQSLVSEHKISTVIDLYDGQLQELEKIDYSDGVGHSWIFYPWSGKLLHTVDENALFVLRTNRNKLLITADEQKALSEAVVGIAGMSVGAGIAIATVYSGMSDTIKIADRDTLDTSNLNRLREPLLAVGQEKTKLAANHIYEINPFADVHEFSDGITAENIDAFFADPKLSVVIDEIDDFKMKVQLRTKAKEHKIPLIMFTSLGDNILIDIERFDLEPNRPIFHGIINNLEQEITSKTEITPEDIRRYSVQLVGAEYIPTRALESVARMGTELVGRPQLYSTIAVDGGLAAYTIRQIILDADVTSGRYFVAFANLLGLKTNELSDTPERQSILQKLSDS